MLKFQNNPLTADLSGHSGSLPEQFLIKPHTMNIEKFQVQTSQNWKFGLITREIFRVNEDLFEINDLSDGWITAKVDQPTIIGLINGNISLTSLEWQ